MAGMWAFNDAASMIKQNYSLLTTLLIYRTCMCFRNGAQLQEDRHPQPGHLLRLWLCDAVPQVRTTASTQQRSVVSLRVSSDSWTFCASVLYCRYAFSKNNQPTMLPIPNSNVAFGNAKEMSRTDIARLNTLYGCCKCPLWSYTVHKQCITVIHTHIIPDPNVPLVFSEEVWPDVCLCSPQFTDQWWNNKLLMSLHDQSVSVLFLIKKHLTPHTPLKLGVWGG